MDFNSNPDNVKFVSTPLNVSSEFPFGYSLNSGRLQYYYSEYISFNILNSIKSKKLDIRFSNKINDNDDLNIKIISDSCYSSNVVESMVLDVFDFDIESFRHVLTSYNLMDDILNPLGEKPWLFKDKINDVIIW